MLFSAKIGAAPAAVIDGAFLIALAAVAMQEIVAGKNWRNLRVLAVLGVLIAGNVTFHWEAIHGGSAALRHAARHRGHRRAHHAGRRTHRAELHAQLAGARESGPVAAVVRALRRGDHRRRGRGSGALGRIPDAAAHRISAAARRRDAGRAACALGRRPHVARSARAHSPCWLRVRADRLPAARRGAALAGDLAGRCRPPRLDRRRHRHHDARGDDAGDARTYRPAAGGDRRRRRRSMCWPWWRCWPGLPPRLRRRACCCTSRPSPGSGRSADLPSFLDRCWCDGRHPGPPRPEPISSGVQPRMHGGGRAPSLRSGPE